jgi:hypothetical protein
MEHNCLIEPVVERCLKLRSVHATIIATPGENWRAAGSYLRLVVCLLITNRTSSIRQMIAFDEPISIPRRQVEPRGWANGRWI